MDFRQLEAFVMVVDKGSFSRAAEAIFLSQPSVSTYISSLEKELGTPLVNRSTKEVSPTLAGKILYESAKEMLTLKSQMTDKIKGLSGDFSGVINIIASSVPAQYILPRAIAQFNAFYPDIAFNVKQGTTLDVARSIASGQAELGFSGGIVDDIDGSKCTFHQFLCDRMIMIAPSNDDFGDDLEYSLKALLREHRFVGREKGSGTRIEYERYLEELGMDIRGLSSSINFDNTQSIINAVINGLGVSMISHFAAASYIHKKMVIPLRLTTPLPNRKLYYVLKKNFAKSHLADLFIDFLITDYKKILEPHIEIADD
ncbi:MAG: selenium metabolism-associated LysR family transcriptional regulator [Defluviitaleaceae bacterium]|nr:selenium metabolism-associated LysR family transcriptional regulator [Defluviitaleaceae bacterium]